MMLRALFSRGSIPGGALAVTVTLFAIAATATLYAGGAVQNTVTHYLTLLVMVIGLGVFTGNSGVLSFGHMAFVALGAYSSALLTLPLVLRKSLLPHLPAALAGLHLDFALALVVAIVLVSLVGLLCGLFICRLGGAAAVIATLGLMIITNSLLIGASDLTRGSQAIYGVPKVIGPMAAAGFASVAFLIARIFKDTRYGLTLRAVREDEVASQSLGIQVPRTRLIAWCLSVAFMAVGGVMFAHHVGVFSPKEFFFVQTFALLVMLIVGGMTSVSGAVMGTTLIVVVIEVLRRLEEGVSVFGLQTPQLFGLTDIGLSVAILFALYRRGTGLTGYAELDDFFPRRTRPAEAEAKLAAGQEAPEIGAGNRPPDRITALEARGLTKSYGGVTALSAVDLAVRPGEIVGLIGPNGSGKTTLLSCLSGIQAPSSGRVFLDGRDVSDLGAPAIASLGVGRTFQNIRLFGNLSVQENVEAAALAAGGRRWRRQSRALAGRILRELSLDSLSEWTAKTLAYGQQRRLEIARALALEPTYLLLDEPAAGMNDSETQSLLEFLSRLRSRQQIGILVVEHDLHLIMQLCDRVVVINKGEVIAEGSPEEVRRNSAVIEAYIGTSKNRQTQRAVHEKICIEK